MPWFYNAEIKERCEIDDIKVVGVRPSSTYGGKAVSELKIKFRSRSGPGEVVVDADDKYIAKAINAYTAEFLSRKHQQLSLFKDKQANKSSKKFH